MSERIEQAWMRGAVLPLALGAVAGFILWAASPQLTGHQEPWDGDFGFYLCYLLAVGVLSGIAMPRHFWACPVGLYVGQVVAMLLLLEIGSLAPLGLLLVLPAVCGLSLAGWCIGAGFHYLAVQAYMRFTSRSAAGRSY
jgi:hypothetical protein